MSEDKNREEKVMPPEKYDAFMAYYSMGERRSVRVLAEQLQMSEKTLELWCTKYQWPKRVKEFDKKAQAELEEQLAAQVAKTKVRYSKLIDTMLSKVVDGRNKKIRIKCKNVRDVVDLMKMQMFIMGEATDRQEFGGKITWQEIIEKLAKPKS